MVKVHYVGYDNTKNYGDDFNKILIKNFGFNFDENAEITLFGGGTLFPIRKPLLDRIKNKNPKEIIVFGSGCDTPEFYNGDFEKDLEYTKNLLKRAKFIGVRDEYTKKTLGMGEVIGDPFFSITLNKLNIKRGKYGILNVGRSGFNNWGGIDGELDTYKNMLKFTKKILMDKEKNEMFIIPFFINDILIADDANKYIKQPHIRNAIENDYFYIPYIFKYAEFSLTYKLHAMILSIATNTPVIPIEYKPKIRHTAQLFGIEHLVLRTDEVTEKSLEEKYELLKTWDNDKIQKRVDEFRNLQQNFFKRIKKCYGHDYEYGEWTKKETIEYLDKLHSSEFYIRNVNIQSNQLMTGLIEHLPNKIKEDLKNTDSILDWGCGIGSGTNIIGKLLNKNVTGLDISKVAIKKAKEMFPDYKFVSEELNKKFDVIINSNCLEHINHPDKIVEKHEQHTGKYYIILAPYKGRIVNEIGDHILSLDENSFPKKIGNLERIFFDTFIIYPGWKLNEKQMLLVYKKRDLKNENFNV